MSLSSSSPSSSPSSGPTDSESLSDLLQELNYVITSLAPLEEIDFEKKVNSHIKRLHKYNEVKDGGQKLLGKLAELSGTSVRELYGEYDLNLND